MSMSSDPELPSYPVQVPARREVSPCQPFICTTRGDPDACPPICSPASAVTPRTVAALRVPAAPEHPPHLVAVPADPGPPPGTAPDAAAYTWCLPEGPVVSLYPLAGPAPDNARAHLLVTRLGVADPALDALLRGDVLLVGTTWAGRPVDLPAAVVRAVHRCGELVVPLREGHAPPDPAPPSPHPPGGRRPPAT